MQWNSKDFYVVVGNNNLVAFEYADFGILINNFTATPGYWQMCVVYILAISASSPESKESTTDPMLSNVKKNYDFCVANLRY